MELVQWVLGLLVWAVMLQPVHPFYWDLWAFNNMCTEDKGLTFARRNPWDCNRYLACVSGVAFPGKCPPGLVYRDSRQRCLNPLPPELDMCGRSVVASLESACADKPGWTFTSPFSCAQFFECAGGKAGAGSSSQNNLVPQSGLSARPTPAHPQNLLQVMECPYPSFFSSVSGSCESFDQVKCGSRPQPKAPCDYIQYSQLCDSPKCPPCSKRHPSCVGLSNGAHALTGFNNLYILCYAERTFDVRKCNVGYIFSKIRKTCVQKAV